MSNPPEAAPHPGESLLQPETTRLCVASPVDFTEACFSVPAMRALRHFGPHLTMAVLCPRSQQALWQTVPELDHVISYQDGASTREVARRLADFDATFESALIWEQGKAAKALAQVGVIRRFGHPVPGLEKFLTDVVAVASVPGPIEHRVRYYLNFVEQLGCDGFVKSNFQRAPLPPAPDKPRIVLAPWSEYGSAHQWPVERFKQVMDVMDARYPGIIEWLVPSGSVSGENSDARGQIDAMFAGGVKCDSSERDWEQLMDMLRNSSVLLACDGELAHMAAHLGLPAAVIFGPNEPEWRRPLGAQSLVIREHVACSPCYLAKCPLDHRCQLEVSVDTVVASLEEALKLR